MDDNDMNNWHKMVCDHETSVILSGAMDLLHARSLTHTIAGSQPAGAPWDIIIIDLARLFHINE